MQSDITLSYCGKTLIIDAKCYGKNTQSQYSKHTIHSHNLYQIFTYVKNKTMQEGFSDHEISGLLLYARTIDEIQPDVDYSMSGNQISVKTLDLNQPFPVIAQQLDQIAEREFGNGIVKMCSCNTPNMREEEITMKAEYDFTNAVKNPYVRPKPQAEEPV